MFLSFCFLLLGCMGDTQFHFRIRSTSKLPTKKGNIISEKDVPVVLQVRCQLVLKAFSCFNLSLSGGGGEGKGSSCGKFLLLM